MVIRNKVIFITSFLVGLVGSAIGGFLGNEGSRFTDNPTAAAYMANLSIPAGAISGFLACFGICIWFSKYMQGRSWGEGIVWGLLFGGFAGAISGFITGIVRAFGESKFATADFFLFFISGVFGAVMGVVAGLISGFILAFLAGSILAKLTSKC